MSDEQEKIAAEEVILPVENIESEVDPSSEAADLEELDGSIDVDESYEPIESEEVNETAPSTELPLDTSDDYADDDDDEGVQVVDVVDLEAISETREERIERYKKLVQQQDNQKVMMLFRSLQKAFKTGSMIQGVLTGTMELGDEENQEVCAVMLYDNEVKILIPYPEFFRRPAYTGNSKEEQNRKKTLLQDMIGAEINCIITSADFQEGTIIASRVKALEILERINYTPDEKTKRRRINVKDFAWGRVMAVRSRSIIVNLGGIDATIRANNLTHKFIENENTLRDMFHVNDRIQVEVDEIREMENGRYFIRISRKSLELIDSMIKLENHVAPHHYEKCVATISDIKPNKENITMYLDQYKMPAISKSVPSDRFGDYLKVGDKVLVTVISYRRDGMIIANIFEKLPY